MRHHNVFSSSPFKGDVVHHFKFIGCITMLSVGMGIDNSSCEESIRNGSAIDIISFYAKRFPY